MTESRPILLDRSRLPRSSRPASSTASTALGRRRRMDSWRRDDLGSSPVVWSADRPDRAGTRRTRTSAERRPRRLGSPDAGAGDHLRDRGFGALQHLDRAAGARGAGGGARARAAGVADRAADPQPALVDRDADRAARLAAGDRRAADGAADRRPALPRQRAGAAALARRHRLGETPGAARVRRGRGDRRRRRRDRLGGARADDLQRGRGADRDRPGAGHDPGRRPLCCARAARRGGDAGGRRRRVRLRLDGDRLEAPHRRTLGRLARRSPRSGSPPRPPRRGSRCSAR